MHANLTLLVSMPSLLLTIAVTPLFASGHIVSYTTEYTGRYPPKAVYKSIDSAGNVTYSATWPRDTVTIEEITLSPGPPAEYVEDTRQRLKRIKETALLLAEAREQREADREEEEKKRLERLALQRSAQAQVYERQVYVGWYPLWRHRQFHRYGSYYQQIPPHPARRPGLSRGIPLRSGASLR